MKSAPDEKRRRAGERESVSGGRPGVDPALWIKWSEAAMLESMKWFDVWLQGTQRFWGAGFRTLGRPVAAKEDLRRVSDMPWIPHLEAEVIPLRRKTDQPGAEATRISMRVPMPWPIGGADVISLQAIVGRRSSQDAESQDGADSAGPDENRKTQG